MQERATKPYGCNVRVYGAAEKDSQIQICYGGVMLLLPVTNGESAKSIAARLRPLLVGVAKGLPNKPKVSVTSRKSSNKVVCP